MIEYDRYDLGHEFKLKSRGTYKRKHKTRNTG